MEEEEEEEWSPSISRELEELVARKGGELDAMAAAKRRVSAA